jgi:hypothetical protein
MDYFFLCRHDRNEVNKKNSLFLLFGIQEKELFLLNRNKSYLSVCIFRYRRCTNCYQS